MGWSSTLKSIARRDPSDRATGPLISPILSVIIRAGRAHPFGAAPFGRLSPLRRCHGRLIRAGSNSCNEGGGGGWDSRE